MIMENLTERQNEVLDVIKKYIADNGYPPTVREIGDILGLSSPATIQVHFDNLDISILSNNLGVATAYISFCSNLVVS